MNRNYNTALKLARLYHYINEEVGQDMFEHPNDIDSNAWEKICASGEDDILNYENMDWLMWFLYGLEPDSLEAKKAVMDMVEREGVWI